MKKNYLIKVPLKESPSTILIGKNILRDNDQYDLTPYNPDR